MRPPRVEELGQGRLLLDLRFRDHEGLISAYLFPQEGGWTLVETGPTSCREALLGAVGRSGVAPDEVRRVIVTHIHLDHAGGLGAIASAFPRAELFAHEKGVRHLVDPTRLIESARRAWGASADPLWGPIVPAPAPRLHSLQGGERLAVAGGALEVIATPGHAQHHVSLFDSSTRSLVVGDSAGVRVTGLWRPRPAIPPPDLDLELLFSSLDRMEALDPARLLYSHYGPSPEGGAELRRYRTTVKEWRDVALHAMRESATVEHVAAALQAHEEQRAASARAPVPAEDRGTLVSGYGLAAQGLLRYVQVHGQTSG